ncbi:MAG: hypothetical protein WCV86_04300 [Patescibacteria group bacterium]
MIEAVVAVGILLAGVTALITLSIATLKADQISSRKIVAINLAREALEVARNVRDSNWLAGRHDDCSGTLADDTDNWFYGLEGQPFGSCGVVPTEYFPQLETVSGVLTFERVADPLDKDVYLTSAGLYNQDLLTPVGTKTIYRRWVTVAPQTISSPKINYVDLTAHVEYTLDNRIHSVELATRLYNWKP